jgi:hypothetical protein
MEKTERIEKIADKKGRPDISMLFEKTLKHAAGQQRFLTLTGKKNGIAQQYP